MGDLRSRAGTIGLDRYRGATMLRYVACVWNSDDPSQQREANFLQRRMMAEPRWRVLLDAPGLLVLGAGIHGRRAECYELPERGGVVLGNLFNRSDTTGNCRVGLPAANTIVESDGRYLVDHYHGEYVAFVRDTARRSALVVQGPSAGRSAYRTCVGGMFVYFTELADLTGRVSISIDIDWDYLASHVIAPIRDGRATALRAIAAMEGGDCDEVREGRVVTRSCWSPVTFALRRHED